MEFFGFIIWAAIIYGIYRAFKGRKRSGDIGSLSPADRSIRKERTYSYKKRSTVFNNSEAAFFIELKRKLPSNFYVFPKIRIADFLAAMPGQYYDKYNLANKKIMPKHVDFLIVDFSFRPVVAIEINGNSHLLPKREESDRFKREVFESVNLRLEVIRVGENFSSSIDRIISSLNSPK